MYFFAGQPALSPIRLRPSGTDSSNELEWSAVPSLLGSGAHTLSRRLHAGRMPCLYEEVKLHFSPACHNIFAPRISPPSPPPHGQVSLSEVHHIETHDDLPYECIICGVASLSSSRAIHIPLGIPNHDCSRIHPHVPECRLMQTPNALHRSFQHILRVIVHQARPVT